MPVVDPKLIAQVLDAAARRMAWNDLQLSEHLGIGHSSLAHWRRGKAWPDDRNLRELAKLAGLHPYETLRACKLAAALWAKHRVTPEDLAKAVAAVSEPKPPENPVRKTALRRRS